MREGGLGIKEAALRGDEGDFRVGEGELGRGEAIHRTEEAQLACAEVAPDVRPAGGCDRGVRLG